MRDGICMRTVLATSRQALRLRTIVKRNVMNFVAAMQLFQHLERADLSAFRRRVKKIRFNPEDFHGWDDATSARLSRTGQRPRLPVTNRSPQIWKVSKRHSRSVSSDSPVR